MADTFVTSTVTGATFTDGSTLGGTWTSEYDATGMLVAVSNATFTVSGSGGTTTFTDAGTLPYADSPADNSYEIRFGGVSGGSYTSLYADWQGENPTSFFQGSPSLFTSVVNFDASTVPNRLLNAGTIVANTAPTIAGLPASQSGTDTIPLTPFAAVTITDPSSNAAISASITLADGGIPTDTDGILAGAGLTKTGTGVYSLAATTPADLTAELRALIFTPATNQVAPGSSVATSFDLSVTDGTTPIAADTTTIVQNSAPCFCSGTVIRTPGGEVSVDHLAIGNLVVTASGDHRPIRWIGLRRVDLTAHPRPETVAPVRIQRGAFAENMPHSDLLLSPDHAVFIEGKLICARQLINGTTIRQETGWTSVEYFHVELDPHAILLAEGLPAESYLNTGNRGFFANSGEPLVLHPNLTDESDYPTREAASCAPFVSDEASVRPVWQRLAERAAIMGQPAPRIETTSDPELQIVAKGRTERPLYGENGLYIFVLPMDATEVRLISRAGSPTDVRPWLEDRRCLGVYVERIVLRGASELREIPVDHPGLSQGWHAVEQDGVALRRWTTGDAVLPLPAMGGPTMLEIRANNSGMGYVVEADAKAEVERKVA